MNTQHISFTKPTISGTTKNIILILLLISIFISKLDAQERRSIWIEGWGERQYDLYLPENLTENMPLVLALHGFLSNSEEMYSYMFKPDIADTEGFIVVYPMSPYPGWNAGYRIEGYSFNTMRDDVKYISSLIDTLYAEYHIDLNRVYSCGFSGGGVMTFQLMGEIGNRLAAVASVAGGLHLNSEEYLNLSRSFPILLMYGTDDYTVGWEERKPEINNGLSVMESVYTLLDSNRCQLTSDTVALPDIDPSDSCTVEKISFSDCEDEGIFILYKITDGGHFWPGGDRFTPGYPEVDNRDIDATAEIWNFFRDRKSPPVNIPDMAFLHALIELGVDTDGDSLISLAEAAVVKNLFLGNTHFQKDSGRGITDLTGIEAFTQLDSLDIGCNPITGIDLTRNRNLSFLALSRGAPWAECNSDIHPLVGTIDLSGNPRLKTLWCKSNGLDSLDLSVNLQLEELVCDGNNLTTLDLSNNTRLKHLECYNNQLVNLDLSGNPELIWLWCGENPLTGLDLTSNRNLQVLACGGTEIDSLYLVHNDQIGTHPPIYWSAMTEFPQLSITDMPDLGKICVWDGFHPDSAGIDTSNSPNAYVAFGCQFENVIEIPDMAFLNALLEREIDINSDGLISYYEAEQIQSLDVSHEEISDLTGIEAFLNLDTLICGYNHIDSLDVSSLTSLVKLSCNDNPITDLIVSNNQSLKYLDCSRNLLTDLDVSANGNLITLYCQFNSLENLDISGNLKLTALNCSYTQLTQLNTASNHDLKELVCFNSHITSLNVISNKALKVLHCAGNELISLDVSSNYLLEELSCGGNRISVLDVSKNAGLTFLNCSGNKITHLDVSKNLYLETLRCSDNQLSDLDVSSNRLLTWLDCGENTFTEIDLSSNIKLEALWCSNGRLSSLNVSGNKLLTDLDCDRNQLSALDVAENTVLTALGCSQNQLTSLDVTQNPKLRTLLCNENEITSLLLNNPEITLLDCSGNNLNSLDLSSILGLGSWVGFPGYNPWEPNELFLANMPSLEQVCVREGFIPVFDCDWGTQFENGSDSVCIDTTGSPNIYFTSECNGITRNPEFKQQSFSFFPNPVTSVLTITTEISGIYTFEISSMNGNMIQQRTMEGTTHQLDLSSFQKGVYFITIRSTNHILTKKIVIL